jgi:hypothetical protein
MGFPERSYPILLGLTGSDDPVVARRAARVCVRLRVDGIVPLLRERLASGGPEERATAVRDLVHVLGEDVVPDLMAHVEDPEDRVRAEVMHALGQLEVASAKAQIRARLDGDAVGAVREAAIKAYGKVASKAEREACLARITRSGDRQLIRVAARALYAGTGPRKRTELEKARVRRIRGDSQPEKHIDPVAALRALPEIRPYDEDELTRIVAGVCGDYSTTRRQMVMEGRHALMRREKGTYTFTQMGEAVWRVGQFTEAAKQRLLAGRQD